MNTKRVRSSNFSKQEELMLLEEVVKYREIIESKNTTKISCVEKEEAWRSISASLHNKIAEGRTIQQLKHKYDNLKTRVRNYNKGVTCGISKNEDRDSVIQAILDITSGKNVKLEQDLSTFEYGSPNHNDSQDVQIVYEQNESVKTNSEDQAKRAKVHEIQDPLATDISSEETDSGICETFVSAPRKTQNRKSPILTAKELYYNKKLAFLEQAEEFEMAERKKKAMRDKEEHQKKMVLLDLDIALKKKQLMKCTTCE